MYKGFNIKTKCDFAQEASNDEWLKVYDEHKKDIKCLLDEYITTDGVIDGEKVQEDWFKPIDKIDVFISHSHKDEQLAKNLASWLYTNFGLKSFIDSCIWGYADDLLKMIDDRYCKSSDRGYNYRQRNYSTSHVHMMLLTALNKMIDQSECVFFLNTSNSIHFDDIKECTLSPWIYAEIELSRTIRERKPERLAKPKVPKYKGGGKLSPLQVEYAVDIRHLIDIDDNLLESWKNAGKKGEKALDKLYKLIGVL